MNASRDILPHSTILIEGNHIKKIGGKTNFRNFTGDVIDAKHLVAVPGFIQTHIHLCQTLFRGLADDLQLLDLLQQKIFPFEAAHNEHSMYVSALLGVAELFRSGTTTILDMGSIHFEEEIIRAVGESGMRAFLGKAMMDRNDLFPQLKESTTSALSSTRNLAERFHNSYDCRVKYAAAPRFVLSCSEKLLRETGEMVQNFDGMLLHTHASENKNEIAHVKKLYGKDNITALHSFGTLSEKTILAHCVHLSAQEMTLLQKTKTHIAHCPSSNLKLASGIANVPQYRAAGINVTLGADGAPCNNSLSIFQEMRLAALLQKPFHGATAMDAQTAFELATVNGAKALGLSSEIGSIEIGKKADIVLLDLNNVWNPVESNAEQLYSSIVYSATRENIHSVMLDGRWIVRNKELIALDEKKIFEIARRELKKLRERV